MYRIRGRGEAARSVGLDERVFLLSCALESSLDESADKWRVAPGVAETSREREDEVGDTGAEKADLDGEDE